jgi:uncharacterized protein (TIGR02302 family)
LTPRKDRKLRRLRWWLLSASLILHTERLGVALWPAMTVAALLLGAALIGVPAVLPAWLHLGILAAAIAAIAGLSYRSWRRLPALRAAARERRLERDSGLHHRPLAVLRDRPAGGGEMEQALWQRHRARAQDAIAHLRLRGPDPLLAASDTMALRAAATVLLVAGAVIAGPQAGSRIATLFAPGFSEWRGAPAPLVQAWVMPPGYTGLPPIFLPMAGVAAGAVSVPRDSRLTISITGISARPDLSMAGTQHRMETLGNDSFQSALTLTEGGRLRVGTFFSDLARWDIKVLPNEKPVAEWTAPPGRAGASLSTKFPWKVSQRWGVASLQAELRPAGRPDLPSFSVPLSLPGTPKQAIGAATADLSENPLAGVMITGRLVARDVSGQTGAGAGIDFVLPARNFHHPLARAIADLRRRIALHPDETEDAAADLAALAEAPFAPNDPSGLPATGVALNLATAATLLGSVPHPPASVVAEVQARLWTLALALDGALPDASARALAEAQQRLREGLEDRANGRLSDKELGKRLDALREALDKRLADIAKQAMQKGAIQKFDPQSQHLSSSAMDRLMRQMQQAMREGRMQDAQQKLAELQKMMEQLKNAHVMSREEMQQQQQQARRGRQMMGAVQDLVQRETTLLDHAQTRMPQQMPGVQPFRGFNFMPPPLPPDAPPDEPPPQAGDMPQGDLAPHDAAPPSDQAQQQPTPHQAGPAEQAQDADARTQRALHRALGAMSDSFAGGGGKKPHALEDAGHAMEEAAGALAQHDDPVARDAIGRAIAALQQGGQDMARQMSSASAGQMQLSLQPGGRMGENGNGQEGDDEGEDGQGGRKKDPFGRQVDGNGTMADDPSLRVPDEMEQGRSRAIQEELRRRGANRERPQEELDYIGRLLKPF